MREHSKHFALSALIIVGLALTLNNAKAQSARGKLKAVMVPKGPTIDGKLTDPIWQRCPELSLGACTENKPLKYKTSARVVFDASHVYVGISCQEPDTAGLPAKCTHRDDRVWRDDSIEVFLRADPEKPFYQFTVNPKGVMYDASNKNGSWNCSAEVKAAIDDGKAWTATLKIPMAELGAFVGDNLTWSLNLNRTRHPRGGDGLLEYSWAILKSKNFLSPSEFGVIEGIKIPKKEGGVTRVRTSKPITAKAAEGKQAGGVTVYAKAQFDGKDTAGWQPSDGSKIGLTDDAIAGKALKVEVVQRWAGTQFPLRIKGSKNLKIAFHMKGRHMPAAGVNIYDKSSEDNTTPYGHRYLKDGEWTPVLYRMYRCHYNSKATGFVSPHTEYNNVRFYGPSRPQPGTTFILDNFVMYRGTDNQAPGKVTGLKANAASDGVKLKWEPASDNVAPMLYVISRSGPDGTFTKIAESCSIQYLDTTAGKGKRKYRVLAVDFEENLGPWSDVIEVDSVSEAKPRELTREENARFAYAEHVKTIYAKGKGKVLKDTVALVGDSLTGATMYPQCAQAAFKSMIVKAHGVASVRSNFGRGAVPRALKGENPAFACILYGTNNSKAAKAIPPAMDDLEFMVKKCEEHGTIPILGTIPPRGFKDPASTGEANYNKSVIELCKKLKIPTGHIFEDIQAGGPRKKFISKDGVHWVGAGMAVAGKAWAKALAQVKFVLRDRP